VEVGARTLRVEATLEQEVKMAGGAARNLAFRVSLRGEEPGMRIDVLGKGSSPKDADDRAAQEWAALAGTALVDAFRDTGRSEAVFHILSRDKRPPGPEPEPAHQAGSFRVYPGIADFRGAVKGGNPKVDHGPLLQAMVSDLAALEVSRPHVVLVSVRHDGRVECEKVQVDGVDSPRLCDVARAFAWPAPETPYAARQTYVLVPGDMPPEPPSIPVPEPAPSDPPAAPAPPVAP
jgi:hypothetical protein